MSLRKRKPVYCRHSLELEIPFFDVDATHARWMKRKGFAAAYGALADEYAVLGERLRARRAAFAYHTKLD